MTARAYLTRAPTSAIVVGGPDGAAIDGLPPGWLSSSGTRPRKDVHPPMDEIPGSLALSELDGMKVLDVAGAEVGELADVVASTATDRPVVTAFFIDRDEGQLAASWAQVGEIDVDGERLLLGVPARGGQGGVAAPGRAPAGGRAARQPGAGHAPARVRARAGRRAGAGRGPPGGRRRRRQLRGAGPALRPGLHLAPPAEEERRLRALGRRQPDRAAPVAAQLRGVVRRARRAAPGRHRRGHQPGRPARARRGARRPQRQPRRRHAAGDGGGAAQRGAAGDAAGARRTGPRAHRGGRGRGHAQPPAGHAGAGAPRAPARTSASRTCAASPATPSTRRGRS